MLNAPLGRAFGGEPMRLPMQRIRPMSVPRPDPPAMMQDPQMAMMAQALMQPQRPAVMPQMPVYSGR